MAISYRDSRCTTLGPSDSRSGANYKGALREILGPTCYCNELADDMEPGVCHVICTKLFSQDCVCKNYEFGGTFCDENICVTSGRTFCMGIPMPSPCHK